jgi:glutathione synthase/RimK-type ligase-like ATP-grasp enzyme
LGIQSALVQRIFDDKIYTKKILKRCWFVVAEWEMFMPKGNSFFDVQQRKRFRKKAKKIGFPLIWKPIRQSLWHWVVLIESLKELQEQVALFEQTPTLYMIEKYIRGREYRITYFDGEILFAYEKIWPGVAKNIAQWSEMKFVTLSQEDAQWVHRIAKTFSHNPAVLRGWLDVIADWNIRDGVILEINASPWLKGLQLLSEDKQKTFRSNMRKLIKKNNGIC